MEQKKLVIDREIKINKIKIHKKNEASHLNSIENLHCFATLQNGRLCP